MMEGAISHMALTGGWSARKSPPYTVSSKCFQGESPSPFVLTAPLMPPCAQTECERLTGTTEKRSTECPASAIFIAAARPARPPPTIATRMPLFAMLCESYQSEESAVPPEGHLRVDADGEEQKPEGDAGVARVALRALADDDAPVHREEPQPVRQMPHRRRDADEVDEEDDVVLELLADD